jgi:L-amino acid N-acyltransferase YncA
MDDVVIEPLTDGDWPPVLAIYEQGIASGATFETEAPDWDRWHAAHAVECRLVARSADEVVGWAALSPVSKRRVYRGVAEVSVYVHAETRGRGIGRMLLNALITCAEAAGYWTLQASVFPENAATVHLHRSLGFREVGRRERIAQLNGKWRDTLLLERRSA